MKARLRRCLEISRGEIFPVHTFQISGYNLKIFVKSSKFEMWLVQVVEVQEE
jgi:hypothetical protein